MSASNAIEERTFVDFGTERLVALCGSFGAGSEARGFLRAFELLVHPWGQRRIGKSPAFRSEVADDGAPFEFSIALSSGHPELQVYVDPQADPPAALADLLIIVGAPALSRVCWAVKQHLHAQNVAIKG